MQSLKQGTDLRDPYALRDCLSSEHRHFAT